MSDEFDPKAFLAEPDFDPKEFLAEPTPAPLTPEEQAGVDALNERQRSGGASSTERTLGQLVSFLSGSPLFGTVAKAGDALTGQRSAQSAQRATEQFSPKVGNVPVLPVLGGIAATLPAGAANIAPRAGAALLGTRGAMAARAGLQGAIGGVQAADRGGGAGDVALGTGIGLAGGALGEGAGALARRVTQGAASRVGNVVQGQAARDAEKVAKEVAKLEGQYGAATQGLERGNENLTRHVAGLPSASGSLLPAQTQQKALNTLMDPETQRVLTEIAERNADNIPKKAAEYLRLQTASQAAQAAAPAEAAKRTSDYFNQSVFKTEVAPRLGALAQRGVVAGLAGGVSSLVNGQFGAGVASVLGGQGLLKMGRNLVASPRVQRSVLEGVVSGAEGIQPGLRRMGSVARPDYGNTAKQALDPEEQDGVDAFLSNSP